MFLIMFKIPSYVWIDLTSNLEFPSMEVPFQLNSLPYSMDSPDIDPLKILGDKIDIKLPNWGLFDSRIYKEYKQMIMNANHMSSTKMAIIKVFDKTNYFGDLSTPYKEGYEVDYLINSPIEAIIGLSRRSFMAPQILYLT